MEGIDKGWRGWGQRAQWASLWYMRLDELLDETCPILERVVILCRTEPQRCRGRLFRGRETGGPARPSFPELVCGGIGDKIENKCWQNGPLFPVRNHLDLAVGDGANGMLLYRLMILLYSTYRQKHALSSRESECRKLVGLRKRDWAHL